MQLCRRENFVTRRMILDKLSPYDIYRWEIGEFTVGRPIVNHLRGEKQASMTIFQGQDGKLHHYDQGDDYWKGDCFDIVCQKYGISLIEALNKIACDFMLTSDAPEAYKAITSQYSAPTLDPKQYALIQGTVKKFTRHELVDYWGRYKVIDEKKLKRHEVYSMKEVFLNRRKVIIDKNEMVFGYWYEGLGWKIMFPERSKDKKWLSNIPLDTPEGLQNLNKDHDTLVIKSKKCLMVMEEVYPYLCGMQNESLGSVSDTTAGYIDENSKRVFYGGDSDPAGKKASYRITEKRSWYHINTPDKLLPAKDWSDWAEVADSLDPIINHIKQKGLR